MATKTEVAAKLHELIRRLDDAGDGVQDTLAESLPDPKVVEVHIDDLDDRFWTEMAGGRFGDLREGAQADADIKIRLSSDDLVDLVDGNASLFSKVLAGHVRIDASLSDLLRLRKLAG